MSASIQQKYTICQPGVSHLLYVSTDVIKIYHLSTKCQPYMTYQPGVSQILHVSTNLLDPDFVIKGTVFFVLVVIGYFVLFLGTFLCNNEKERKSVNCPQNSLFMVLWSGLYQRSIIDQSKQKEAWQEVSKIREYDKELRSKVTKLRRQLASLEREALGVGLILPSELGVDCIPE
ncbi:MTMR9 [Mytilus coruscus]|uniref:MTMR9 n=1 Tax=Mytilus coruscus TaxID=42192 RepID=A0A6J8C969_MYTCO|nr:MTMR9 [Mytilus coruscus]